VKAAPFAYHAPRSTGEVLRLITDADNYRLLAGGQSLVPMLNLRLLAPDLLIDLNGVEELAGIEQLGKVLRIGAMTRQRSVERSKLVQSACPLLTLALEHVGHQQTRNRGTIGGSLCHMDPGAELPVVAAALDATMHVASARGVRSLKFDDFAAGVLETHIQPGEMLTHLEVPTMEARTGAAFEEFSRRPADFAIVSCACLLTLDGGGKVMALAVALGGVAPVPVRLRDFEQAAIGRPFGPEFVAQARAAAAEQPADDVGEYPGAYRSRLAGVLAVRALLHAHERASSRKHHD